MLLLISVIITYGEQQQFTASATGEWHLVPKRRSSLADGPPIPKVIEQRCLEYQYTKIGRQTYFGQWTPQVIEMRCLEYQHTKLGRQIYFGWWTPPKWEWISWRQLHWKLFRSNLEVCSYLAYEHTLADGPPLGIEQRCLEYQYTQLWPMNPPGNQAEMPWIPVHPTLANGSHGEPKRKLSKNKNFK